MMVEKKRFVVCIHGKEYVLMSDDAQEHVLAAAQLVDEAFASIATKSANIDVEKVAVLVALRFASDLIVLKEQSLDIAIRHEALVKSIAQELIS